MLWDCTIFNPVCSGGVRQGVDVGRVLVLRLRNIKPFMNWNCQTFNPVCSGPAEYLTLNAQEMHI
jgi:hypothetical protein